MRYGDAILDLVTRYLRSGCVIVGNGLTNPYKFGGYFMRLAEKLPDAIVDTPISEAGYSGMAVGMALAGVRTILYFERMNFMRYAYDALFNELLKAGMIASERCSDLGILIWTQVNRGKGLGAQHVDCFYSEFMQHPGIELWSPWHPREFEIVLDWMYKYGGIRMIIDDRDLYGNEYDGSEPFGAAVIAKSGDEITLVSFSAAFDICMRAVGEDDGVEVIRLSRLKPLDIDLIAESVKKTGKLLVVEPSWVTCGIGSEIAAGLLERGIGCRMRRLGLPECSAPAGELESAYWLSEDKVIREVEVLRDE